MSGIGHKADMVFTDPPYGVSYEGTNHAIIKNDDLRGDKLYNMLLGAFECMNRWTREQPAIYICYATKSHKQFEAAVVNAGFTLRQILIREKQMVL